MSPGSRAWEEIPEQSMLWREGCDRGGSREAQGVQGGSMRGQAIYRSLAAWEVLCCGGQSPGAVCRSKVPAATPCAARQLVLGNSQL